IPQSTNHPFPTPIHIPTLIILQQLLITIQQLHPAFRPEAKHFDHLIKMPPTHLQHPLPIPLPQQFQPYTPLLPPHI
ncbi:lyase family protein, partial [Bacillus thuringiensis]|uniref:lyase family protein n=1 Tax=Bacillus thuringiensis TaxID=1428 RepID=UPI0021B693FA